MSLMTEVDWDFLIGQIEAGKCTPFLGAGACAGVLPLGSHIAEDLARTFRFPFADGVKDLARVSQFMSNHGDPEWPKRQLLARLQGVMPNYSQPDEIHGLLAELPLPLYLTTNYDPFMVEALKLRDKPLPAVGKKQPRRELCRWHPKWTHKWPSPFNEPDEEGGASKPYEPSPEKPLVFHLHGLDKNPQSLVLTEDDYLDFLINLSEDTSRTLLPPLVQDAVTTKSLLFVGYSLTDWNFRVIFRALNRYISHSEAPSHISVQLAPSPKAPDMAADVQEAVSRHFGHLKIQLFLGDCRAFATKLREKWERRPAV